jgi:hypothetical protein
MKPVLPLTLACALLTGCAVVSEAPLFTVHDATPHGLEDGVWALSGPGCDVGPDPAGRLPDCSAPVIVARGRMSWDSGAAMTRAFGPAARALAALQAPKASDYLLIDGDPEIVELINGATNGPPPASALAIPGAPLKPGYMALRPLHLTRAGLIDRAVVWPVQCPSQDPRPAGFATAGAKCLVQTADALRQQAKVLPPFQSAFLTWVAADGPAIARP